MFYLYMVTSATCSSTLVMRMRGYTGGVATDYYYPYPVIHMRSLIEPVVFICNTNTSFIFFGLNMTMACPKIITF